ncbi:MAG: hypothetical protein QW308_03980 [Candidatus Woesearchaeota archaeon]
MNMYDAANVALSGNIGNPAMFSTGMWVGANAPMLPAAPAQNMWMPFGWWTPPRQRHVPNRGRLQRNQRSRATKPILPRPEPSPNVKDLLQESQQENAQPASLPQTSPNAVQQTAADTTQTENTSTDIGQIATTQTEIQQENKPKGNATTFNTRNPFNPIIPSIDANNMHAWS